MGTASVEAAQGARPPVELACWRTLDEASREAVRGLALDARQLEYAGTTQAAIAACEAGDPAAVRGLALLLHARVVGFVVLKRAPAAPAWVPADAAVVSGLRTDAGLQGRGLGTAALAALAAWVAMHWSECTRVVLRVDDDNAAAIRAYAKAGWVECGERRQGRVGIERTLMRPLAPEVVDTAD